MVYKHIDLSSARILLSNDDGIDARGLKVLEKALKRVAKDVWVVAPETEQSAVSHSLTLRRPLRVRKQSDRHYYVDGTPTDSVLLGVNKVIADKKPDLLISGINRGGNIGEDVTYSGTVAAAMEGTLLGIPSIALSQVYEDSRDVHWDTAEHWAVPVIEKLLAADWPKGILMNVNFPPVSANSVTGIEAVSQGRRKIGSEFLEGKDPRGEPYYWVGPQRDVRENPKGTDLEAVTRGAISVTPLTLDLTHTSTLRSLKTAFK